MTKRPIAELLMLPIREDATAERVQCEREMWQILRRKQGHVAQRLYRRADAPHLWLAYGEWESKRILDGVRQQLQATPLFRRAQATLAGPAERTIVELVGPITSTKGLDLPEGAVAVVSTMQVAASPAPSPPLRTREDAAWQHLAKQPGYLTHLLFRGFHDPSRLGALSHWSSGDSFGAAIATLGTAPEWEAFTQFLTAPPEHTSYEAIPL